MTTTKESLDETATGYHTNESVPDLHIENIYQEYFNEWLIARIPVHARVLEMGHGDGIITRALVEAGIGDLTVVEGAPALVERARRLHPGITVVPSLFEDFQPDAPFDVVLASHILEHVDDPVAILRLIPKWMTAAGKLIIAVPNRNSLHRQLAVMMRLQPSLDTLSPRDLMVGHQRVYSLETLEADIRQSDLEMVETAGFFLKVVPNSMMLGYSHELLDALNRISPSVPKDLLANLAVVAMKRARR